MNSSIHSDKKYIFLLSGLLLLWFILFEFILSPNQILPRPSIVVISIITLFREYQLLTNTYSSLSAIYLSSIISGICIWIFKRYLFNHNNLVGYIAFFLKWMSGIVPGILSGLFLIIWLPDSEYSKYIFIFFASFLYLFNKAEYDLTKVRGEYVDAVVSLGAGKNFVFDKVSWKFIEPALAESLPDLHFHLWSILIVFEFIKGGSGLGSILRTVVLYRDIAGLFVSILIISLLILIGTAMIKYIKNKIYLLEY